MEDILSDVLGKVPQEMKVKKKGVPQEMKVSESVQNDKNGSVADHLIEYIKENCITNKELEKLKIDIENLVNKRLNHGLKQIKEEIKNGLNA